MAHRKGRPERDFNPRRLSFPRDPQAARGDVLPELPRPATVCGEALVAVVQEALLHGTSTRKVDDLIRALGGPSRP
ncbi:MAG: hypothetical protein FJ102_25190 [Deltaproteobacteria bacterium]|nr:hypothetical protein [Deltaproteobacteria bacterium]